MLAWWPVQEHSCLSPDISWNTLQHPPWPWTGISDTDSKCQAVFISAHLRYLKALMSPEMIKRGSYPALVANMCIHKSICICRNTLTFYEKGVNACELWKAFDWNALCYATISSTVWRRKLEWYLKSRCIFWESRGYYRRNRTFRY